MEDKLKKKILKVIKKAKKKKKITFDELNKFLPDEVIEPEVIEMIIAELDKHGVTIVAENDLEDDIASLQSEFIDKKKSKEQESARDDSKSSDPLYLYLREMGKYSVLNTQKELQYFQELQFGRENLVKLVSMTDVIFDEIDRLSEKYEEGINIGQDKIEKIIVIEDAYELNAELKLREIHKFLLEMDKIYALDEKVARIFRRRKDKNSKTMLEYIKQIEDLFVGLRFTDNFIMRIIEEFKCRMKKRTYKETFY